MDYRSFAGEMLRDQDLTQLGNLDQTERTLRAYFIVVDGEHLSRADMTRIKDAFWFAYEKGFENGVNTTLDEVNTTMDILSSSKVYDL